MSIDSFFVFGCPVVLIRSRAATCTLCLCSFKHYPPLCYQDEPGRRFNLLLRLISLSVCCLRFIFRFLGILCYPNEPGLPVVMVRQNLPFFQYMAFFLPFLFLLLCTSLEPGYVILAISHANTSGIIRDTYKDLNML